MDKIANATFIGFGNIVFVFHLALIIWYIYRNDALMETANRILSNTGSQVIAFNKTAINYLPSIIVHCFPIMSELLHDHILETLNSSFS